MPFGVSGLKDNQDRNVHTNSEDWKQFPIDSMLICWLSLSHLIQVGNISLESIWQVQITVSRPS